MMAVNMMATTANRMAPTSFLYSKYGNQQISITLEKKLTFHLHIEISISLPEFAVSTFFSKVETKEGVVPSYGKS